MCNVETPHHKNFFVKLGNSMLLTLSRTVYKFSFCLVCSIWVGLLPLNIPPFLRTVKGRWSLFGRSCRRWRMR